MRQLGARILWAALLALSGIAPAARAQETAATPAVEQSAPAPAPEASAAEHETAGAGHETATAPAGHATPAEGGTHEGAAGVTHGHAGGEAHAAAGGHHEVPDAPYGHLCLGTRCELLRVQPPPEPLDVMHHIADGKQLELPLLPFLGHIHLPRGFTKVSAWMLIAALVLIGLFALARSGMAMVPKGLYNLLETFVVFVRDEIAIKNMGEHHGRQYTPYLLTVFFFILTCNLLGLLPGGVTVTANINVTATLAVMTLLMTQLGGIMQYGVVHHFKNLVPPGIPLWLMPIMIVVELMGVFAKPFALAVRLFANMTAGHVIILSLLGLIFSFGILFSPVSILFALFIFVLELMVAFLQAFIFTMLTALFIGMSVHVAH